MGCQQYLVPQLQEFAYSIIHLLEKLPALSITPIASLSDTVHMLLTHNTKKGSDSYDIEKETFEDVKDALDTINKRSHGLIRFVNSYRHFTQIPDPDFELFSVRELLERVRHLNKGEARSQDIPIHVEVDPASLELTADPQLIEQALINLVKNAFSALKETDDGFIMLKSSLNSNGRVHIQVHDNGPGINPDNLEKIFIPFYSTTKTMNYSESGSGIGLSLSRQIMRMNRGMLTVQSAEGEGTTFTLQF